MEVAQAVILTQVSFPRQGVPMLLTHREHCKRQFLDARVPFPGILQGGDHVLPAQHRVPSWDRTQLTTRESVRGADQPPRSTPPAALGVPCDVALWPVSPGTLERSSSTPIPLSI